MPDHPRTIAEIREALRHAGPQELLELEALYASDGRKGVASALAASRSRILAQEELERKTRGLYAADARYALGRACIGLDEVGRGPLAGPLTVAGVVLAEDPLVMGLDDSKKLSPRQRECLAQEIRDSAVALSIQHVPAHAIDLMGMAWCLRAAFGAALEDIEAQGVHADVALLDGLPLGLGTGDRCIEEKSIVKGDATCACIAAASIVAKVARDKVMDELALKYPQYGFERNKGYGTQEHQDAIRAHGLAPVHRSTFCTRICQETLF